MMTLSGHRRLMRIAVIMSLLVAIILVTSSARGFEKANSRIPTLGLICYNENNGVTISLSSAQVGGGYIMPTVLETIIINTTQGADPYPSQEVRVAYSPSLIAASVTSGAANFTDGNGQFTFLVHGQGVSGIAYVDINWIQNGAVLRTNRLTISLISEGRSTITAPIWIPGLRPYHPIIYNNSTSVISSACAQARSDWATALPQISFQPGSSPLISFTEPCSVVVGAMGQTFPGTPRKIEFYLPKLETDPWGNYCYSLVCPAGSRHHLRFLAGHELGHALGLDDNPINRSSLMCDNISGYLVWKIESPTTADIDPLMTLYP